MNKRIRKNIGYKRERVILSDILPYEVPPFFSNRYFYNFLVANKIHIAEEELRFKKDTNTILEKLVSTLFGLDKKKCNKENEQYDYFKLEKDKSFVSIPFKFKISHKENDFRELTVIHPINQLQLVLFYDKYKYTILKNTNLSRFSIRKPNKVASLKYFKDKTNKKKRSKTPEIEIIETSDKEYTSLKAFFSYKKFSNVYKFYESYDYQRAEKKFNNLLKFDISRCFDSIYTHTLPWALSNKKIVKENLLFNKDSFGGIFDKLMQQMNYNETNGIVIGPEFSRIFAELILQRIDKNVEKELYKKGYKFKEHYDICRYVDDYFVFYNDDIVKEAILKIYKIRLQEYNLFFNESKTKILPKPIITSITIAKEEIRKLVEYSMIFRFYDSELKNQIGIKYFFAKDIITNYKSILLITQTSYKDLQNYFLSIIFNKLKNLIKKIQEEQESLLNLYLEEKKEEAISDNVVILDNSVQDKIKEQEKIVRTYHSQLFKNFNEIIELTFFIYSVLPRVTYSIKVCHILFRIIDFIKNQEKTKQNYSSQIQTNISKLSKYIAFDFDKKHIIFKKIYDGILGVFNRSASSEYAEVETLYLLPLINELGKHYKLTEGVLIYHFNINNTDNVLNYNINYFTLISILNHIKRDSSYNNLREYLLKIITNKFSYFDSNKAEDIFLLIDILTCPYLGNTDNEVQIYRKKILKSIKFFDAGTSESEENEIINKIDKSYSNWFFHWKNNNLGIELNTKRGHSVY